MQVPPNICMSCMSFKMISFLPSLITKQFFITATKKVMIHPDEVILVSYTVFHDNENIQQKQDFEKIDQLFAIIFFFIIETEKEILKLPA